MAWSTYHCWLFPVRPGRINTVGRVEDSGWVALASLSTQSREIWPPSAVGMSSLWHRGKNTDYSAAEEETEQRGGGVADLR